MGKFINGWLMITLCYFTVFLMATTLYGLITGLPIDRYRIYSGTYLGILLIIVPYFLTGIYARMFFSHPVKSAFWLSVVPVVCEKVLIYFIGAVLLAAGGDGDTSGVTVMNFIEAEAAPYFTPVYVILGFLSIPFSMWIASRKKVSVQSM
ncbi:hypothetical protein P4S93_02525 [Aneurinibacillus thermoaerophilus]|uniref:Uncharacterized protein n=1 Tax=Aneurinibacillus thermoaerophilus TaxID=143495 RepID=A0A1G7YC30_ANETH|nr:hypothetical protein [Aneurinibacillus thermoaerophilus]MED0756017.1 hypothetical protein [Aneurinibacillus thermoaerophilus]MED0759659.1 hypothetical protein [Aneurinibacillus thermoaerophilus]SDG93859.1 hypothetical protein SAMN04489735_100654 [Aneurinibacillus thermoaerophilus]